MIIGARPAWTYAQPLTPSGDGSNGAWSDIVPLPPALPEVVARDEAGRVTLRAVHVDEGPNIDGRLDDDLYTRVKAITGFIQQEPHGGQPSTEDAQLWISSASTFATNIRFHWEYRPGSDLYVVYGDGRETFDRGFRSLLNRTFAVKLTRLFRF